MHKIFPVYILSIFWLFQVPHLSAQDAVLQFEHPVLNAIEHAEEVGLLTPDESLLQRIYTFHAPHLLRNEFSGIESPILRCFTPVMMEFERRRGELNPQTIQEIETLIQPQNSAATQQHISPSGKFILYYETDGTHVVPLDDTNSSGVPDYIEKAAFAADSSWNYQIQNLGFVDPVLPATPYEIYFRNFQFYGTTTSSMGTTYITIHSNFNGFPANDHPEGNRIGALYATIAHELKHAIQYATNLWRGEAGSLNWSEMDATMMEEITYDDVNDYYNYIVSSNSIFRNPQVATPRAYWHVTWKLYFAEVFGMEFWVDVWERFITDNFKPFRVAIQETLDLTGDSLPLEHIKNHMWHMASGSEFSTVNFGFEERDFYPNSSFEHSFVSVPDSLPGEQSLPRYGARYNRVESPPGEEGNPRITLRYTAAGTDIGLVGFHTDGTASALIRTTTTDDDSLVVVAPWRWADLTRVGIAVVNNGETASSFMIKVDSELPEALSLAQNYPNPFNPSTRIDFVLPERSNVKLQVYDITGRLIQTLTDREYAQGNHTVTFTAQNLASGVYFYRLITSRGIISKKMVLVK